MKAAAHLLNNLKEQSPWISTSKHDLASIASDWTGDSNYGGRDSIDDPVPSNHAFVHHPHEAVRINVHEGQFRPLTIPSFFLSAVQHWGHRDALAARVNDRWEVYTYKTYYDEVLKTAESFIKLGLRPHESVAIACYNSPAYFICALGAVFAGGVFVSFNCMNVKNALVHVLTDSKANIVVVDTHKQMNQILDIWNELPRVKAVIVCNVKTNVSISNPHIFMWKDFLFLGCDLAPGVLVKHLNMLAPNKCCAILYQAGRSDHSNTNGVMLSHDNFTYTARMFSERLGTRFSSHSNIRVVSYLPLNSGLALMLDMFYPMAVGGLVCFSDPDAMKGSLVNTLRETRPSIFLGTTRIWILLQRKLFKRTRRLSWFRRSLLTWARRSALMNFYTTLIDDEKPVLSPPGKTISYVLSKVKSKLGLDRCRMFMSYSGGLKLDTLEYFISLNMPICELFSTSLLAGPHCMNVYEDFQIGSVGMELEGFESDLRIQGKSTGKLYSRGRHVCMGLIHQPISDMVEDEGFIFTGVTAYRGDLNSIFITGTTKEVLMLDNGRMVGYVPIETLFKETLPIVSHCMLVGHGKGFLSMLITLRTEIDAETHKPLDTLTRSVQMWLKQRNTEVTTLSEILHEKNRVVFEAIEDAIITVNSSMRHQSGWIRQWRILPTDFSIANGEIDPFTMELNRDTIRNNYRVYLKNLYS